MGAMASQITSNTIVYSSVYSGRLKNTTKLCVTGLCEGDSPVTGEFPAQIASNAENVSIWWSHHGWQMSPAALNNTGWLAETHAKSFMEDISDITVTS